jgi:hypothetical protein
MAGQDPPYAGWETVVRNREMVEVNRNTAIRS